MADKPLETEKSGIAPPSTGFTPAQQAGYEAQLPPGRSTNPKELQGTLDIGSPYEVADATSKRKMTAEDLREKLENASTQKEKYDALKEYARDHYNNPTFRDSDGKMCFIKNQSWNEQLLVMHMTDVKQTGGPQDAKAGKRTFEGNVVAADLFVNGPDGLQESSTKDRKQLRQLAEHLDGSQVPPKDGRVYTNQGTTLKFEALGEHAQIAPESQLVNHWQIAPR